MMKKIKNKLKKVPCLYNFINPKKNYKVNIFQSFKYKLMGFRPDDYYRYDFKNNDRKEYITQV